jgi:hypothetical protein
MSEPVEEITTHPVQTGKFDSGRISDKVTREAYVVYSKIFGEQPAMITGGCRGGFSSGELIALLYAKTFRMEQWAERFDEAMEGMRGL